MRRIAVEKLEQLALDHLGPDASILDFGCDWVSSGQTLVQLAEKISEMAGGQYVSRAQVSRVLNEYSDDAPQRLERARSEGAFGLADQAIRQADKATGKDDAGAARVKADIRLRVAEAWNRPAFGKQPGGREVNINIALPSAHLAVVRAEIAPGYAASDQAVPPARDARESAAEPAVLAASTEGTAIAAAIDEEAEIVSIESATR